MAGVFGGLGFELFEWPEVDGRFGCVGFVDGAGIDTEFAEDTERTEGGRRVRRFWRNWVRSSRRMRHSTKLSVVS